MAILENKTKTVKILSIPTLWYLDINYF